MTNPSPDEELERLRPALSSAALALLEPLVRHSELLRDGGDVVCTFARDPRDDREDTLVKRQLRFLPPQPCDERSPLAGLFQVCGGFVMGEVGSGGL